MKTILFAAALMAFAAPARAMNVGSQLVNAQLENKSSDYAAGKRGRVWCRTDTSRCKYDDGATAREFADTTSSQTITGKDIDGGTATNTSRLTLPGAATASLASNTRKAKTIAVDTTTNEVKIDDGSALRVLLPVGVILPYGGASAPSGFVLGDGSAVLRAGTYAALFAAVGTSFGAGDGSTTFNLPDCRRRTFVGAGGSGTGTLANTVGSTGGSETQSVTLSTANLPAHSHGLTGASVGSHTTGISIPSSGAHQHVGLSLLWDCNAGSVSGATAISGCGTSTTNSAPQFNPGSSTGVDGAHTHTVTDPGHIHSITGPTDNTGSGTALTLQNYAPSLVVNCIVRY